MQDKTIGYTLMVIGIVIMIFAILQIALLVTRIIKPFPTFQFTQIFQNKSDIPSTALPSLMGKSQGSAEAVSQAAAISALEPDVANDVLNFAVYFFFMSFISTAGYKIASLGVKLVRPAVLKMTPKDVQNILPTNVS